MVNMTDKVVIDLADNDELTEYINSKSPGDECEMEIVASLDEVTEEQAVFSIKDVSVELPGDYEDEEPEEEDDEESPVMAVMGGGSMTNNNKSY
jgi:hypothetical protein